MKELERKMEAEVRHRMSLEEQLKDAQEELKLVPELKEQLLQTKMALLRRAFHVWQPLSRQVEKGVAAIGLGNLHAVCRDILYEWRRLTTEA